MGSGNKGLEYYYTSFELPGTSKTGKDTVSKFERIPLVILVAGIVQVNISFIRLVIGKWPTRT